MNKGSSQGKVLFLSSYPPRKCGLATFTYDLIEALREKIYGPYTFSVCALEEGAHVHSYSGSKSLWGVFNTQNKAEYIIVAEAINNDPSIKTVCIQHEFGLFHGEYGEYLLEFTKVLTKPLSIVFHSVLPNPEQKRKQIVDQLVNDAQTVIVMTTHAQKLLYEEYDVRRDKVVVIPHGTHLTDRGLPSNKKLKIHTENRLVLTTFGLLGPNKGIETALDALPSIIEQFPSVLYFILGKTHPKIIKNEGECYRNFLIEKSKTLGIDDNVRFVDRYFTLEELEAYLHLTDIYLFTSKDPNQTVSGTLAYALAAGCPLLSTPIPHAKEVMPYNVGYTFDFGDSITLSAMIMDLLGNEEKRTEFSTNAIYAMRSTTWENTALAYMEVFRTLLGNTTLSYRVPSYSSNHMKRITCEQGIVQFSKFSTPDPTSGYTIDDNARALIAACYEYKLFNNKKCLELIDIYLRYIEHCVCPDGSIINYCDANGNPTAQNEYENLEDAHGRALWALGVLIAESNIPEKILLRALSVFKDMCVHVETWTSPRARAFAIKGLSHFYTHTKSQQVFKALQFHADLLLQQYKDVCTNEWEWFEPYLTYANAVLPESLLYAYKVTRFNKYAVVGEKTFHFLLDHYFQDNGKICPINNQGWHKKGQREKKSGGEQPIDIAYTIMALDTFYTAFNDPQYKNLLHNAFSWFVGNNSLNQTMYNTISGGCYDGLENGYVNINQGAESTLCYILSRLIMEKYLYFHDEQKDKKSSVVIYSQKKQFPQLHFSHNFG